MVQITGTIPESFGWLRDLTVVDLHSNNLQGTVPYFRYGKKLVELQLQSNFLSGDITQLAEHHGLTTIVLSGNRFNGSLPVGFGDMPGLTMLDVAINQFTGSAPADLGNASNLEYLNLYGNQLTGTVPPSIGQLRKLKGLDLRHNRFTTLPEAIVPAINRSFFFNHTRLGYNPWRLNPAANPQPPWWAQTPDLNPAPGGVPYRHLFSPTRSCPEALRARDKIWRAPQDQKKKGRTPSKT